MNNRASLSSDQLLKILSLSENATAIYTTEKLYIEAASDAMIRLWGKDHSIIGKMLEEAVPELQDQAFIPILRNVWRTGAIYQSKNTPTRLKANGNTQTFYFDFTFQPVKNPEGEVYCILHTTTDVTERNQQKQLIKEGLLREQTLNDELSASNHELASINEELTAINEELQDSYEHLQVLNRSLAQSEIRFRTLVKEAPVAICVFSGQDLIIEIANDKMLNIWGRANEVIGKPLVQARPEISNHPYLQVLKDVYISGETYQGRDIKSVVIRDGKLQDRFFDIVIQPVADEYGSVQRIMSVVTDVTEPLKAKMELERVLEQIQLAKEAGELGMFDLNVKTGNLEWDDRCRKLFGINDTRTVSFEQDFVAGLHEEDRKRVLETISISYNKSINNGGYDTVYRTIGADDKLLRWVKAKGKVFFNENDEATRFIGTVQDVTSQMSATKALQEAEEMLRLSIDAAKLGTWHLDLGNNVYTFSAKLKELFGFSNDEDVTYEDLVNQILPEERAKVEAAINSTLLKGESYSIEYPLNNHREQKRHWLRAIGKMHFDSDHKPTHFAGVAMDITEQKLEEQRKNDFIGMVSHELKTPLTSLKAYVQMLLGKAKKQNDAFVTVSLEKVHIQINKMTSMINSFLNVSRLEAGKMDLNKQHFDLNKLVNEIIEETKLINHSHILNFIPDGYLPVYADRDKIGQVISNLINNAIKYSPNNTEIEVRAEKAEACHARVSVKDQGIGIAPKDAEKLFERFYRIQNSRTQTIAGFGIGLYLCSEIIKRHEGKIWVESAAEKGSTFFFSLPSDKEKFNDYTH